MVYLIGNEAALAVDHQSTSFRGAAASNGVGTDKSPFLRWNLISLRWITLTAITS